MTLRAGESFLTGKKRNFCQYRQGDNNMGKSVWLQELTWEEVAEYLTGKDLILLPIGSTEQHGPAGPLGVDTYAAMAIAEDAAIKAQVLSAPPLWFGDSPHHLDFPGTISLRPETLIALLKDIVHSLARGGFGKFIVLNGHKGTNLAALTAACRTLQQYELPGIHMALTDPLFLSRQAGQIKSAPEHHAGELEISHVWYKHPHLIRQERLTRENVDLPAIFSAYVKPDLFAPFPLAAEVFWSSQEQKKFAPSGSFSASCQASPEKGKRYHDDMVDNLVNFITWFAAYRGVENAKAGL
jgi:creatinine amidohydrolase